MRKKNLPKAQQGKQVSGNKRVSGMYNFNNIHTGPDSTHPGVLKAKADKAIREKNLKKAAVKRKK